MPKITELYAYVCWEADEDDEGVPAVQRTVAGQLTLLPLMGADLERMQSMRDEAQNLANMMGKPIKLLGATELEVIEVLHPKETK